MTSRSYGYQRVSSTSQTNDRQTDALVAAGIEPDHIFSDKISGARQSRPGLDELLRQVRADDSITVLSMDRLGRSALHVMQTLADLEERGVNVVSLKPGESQYTGATGKFMAQMMILVAEWEKSMNAERVAEARAARAARAQAGEQVAGRPRTAMNPSTLAAVKKLHDKGRGVGEIVASVRISRASAYRALAELRARSEAVQDA